MSSSKFDFEMPMVSSDLLDALKNTSKPEYQKDIQDIKQSLDKQFPNIEDLANAAKQQADKSSEQVSHLKNIAESLSKQVDFAISESKDAKCEAMFSKIISVLSVLIALVALFM